MQGINLMRFFEPAESGGKCVFYTDVTCGAGDFRRRFEGQAERALRLVSKRYDNRWIRYWVNSAKVCVAVAA